MRSLPLNTIHQIDCVQGLSKLPPGSVDLAFADPPFNIGYKYDEYDDSKGTREYLDWSRKWISGVYAALKPTGTFWLAIGDEYAAELKLLSQDIGFHCRSWVVWYYTFGVNCTRKFTRSHAHLFHFVKDKTNFTFNENDPNLRVPSARQLVYNDSRGNPNGRLPDDTWVLRPQDLVDGFTPCEDTWYIPRVNGTFKERAGFHGCQMPEQLLGRIIRSCSKPEELVLDPFSGSATTLAVAKKLGRRWVGLELSKSYAARGLARLEGIQPSDRLEGADEPRVSAPATPPAAGGSRSKKAVGSSVVREVGKPSVVKATTVANSAASESAGKCEPLDVAMFGKSIIEAFRRTNDGYSVDRLVADPQLNLAFVEKCRKLRIPGDDFQFNRALFRLRKSGKLSEFTTRRRTEFSWPEVDHYVFASEIAWRTLVDQYDSSLDDIFCNPLRAKEFDRIASSLAPGFSSVEYRWAAFKLRKESHDNRARADKTKFRVTGRPIPFEDIRLEDYARIPGIYLVSHEGSVPVFVGESLDLGARLQLMFGSAERVKFWQQHAPSLHVNPIARAQSISPTVLMANQFLLIKRYNPALNQAVTE